MKDKTANPSAKSAADRASKFKDMDPRNAFDMWLNRKLKDMFDRVADEPLPMDLVDLVRKLEDKEKQDEPAEAPPAANQASVRKKPRA